MDPARPIGIIGLGDLGAPLAQRLVASGRRVVVFDTDAERRHATELPRQLAEIAGNLTDFGAGCEIVLSALDDVATLRKTAIGDAERPGFAAALPAGALVVHFGTGPYRDVLRLTGQLGTVGIGLIDALTCAEPAAVAAGHLDMLAGGFGDHVERVSVALRPLGQVTRIGDTGTATGLASLRSYVRAARLIALSEALLIGRHAGIAPETLARVFDGPIAVGPQCKSIASDMVRAAGALDLASTSRSVADAVAFSERIGVSGECIAFARDMLSEALDANAGGDESILVRHFAALAAAEG